MICKHLTNDFCKLYKLRVIPSICQSCQVNKTQAMRTLALSKYASMPKYKLLQLFPEGFPGISELSEQNLYKLFGLTDTGQPETPAVKQYRRCYSCKYYKKSCDICLLLTRQVKAFDWFAQGNQCPQANTAHTVKRIKHPARYKKIFMNADGSLMPLVDMYHGQTAFICAGGPSFGQLDHSIFNQPGIVTMAVNNTGHLFRPTFWTGQDPQYKFMPSIWLDPKILKFTLYSYRHKNFWDIATDRLSTTRIADCPGMVFHKRSSDFVAQEWIGKDCICWGTPKELEDGTRGARSVLVAALHILYFLGFSKVYLVGVDFKMDDDNKYWFNQDRTSRAIKNNHRVFEHINRHMTDLQPYIKSAEFNVYNCNPESGLTAFPHYPLEKALAENVIDLTDSTAGMYERDLSKTSKGTK